MCHLGKILQSAQRAIPAHDPGCGADLVELAKRASMGDPAALATLVLRAQGHGAREACGQLMGVLRPAIQRHIRSYLGQRCSPSTVASWLEDLTQDAVVRVLLELPELRGELWPCALTIARNTACERVRAEASRRRAKDTLRRASESDAPGSQKSMTPSC
jgi:DNA-directed RNA polymerase specialized sigma24 family protein